jgi:hypothetical protein
MLLINASDVTIEKKAAFQGFHAEQHRGLYAVGNQSYAVSRVISVIPLTVQMGLGDSSSCASVVTVHTYCCYLPGWQVTPELEMLHDLHLDSVLGSGGFAAVMRGACRAQSSSVDLCLLNHAALGVGQCQRSV